MSTFRDLVTRCVLVLMFGATLMAQVGDKVKKLRIAPPADTDLTRFAALADEREAAGPPEQPNQ